jgi:hypothetical protein
VPEELVGAAVLDAYIDQLAAAAIDGVAAHRLEVVGEPPAVARVAQFDGAPHRRVLAEVAPQRAHQLRALQDLDGAQSQQDRRRHVTGQVQPVAEFVCEVRRRVHREIFSKMLGFSGKIKSWGLRCVCVVWGLYLLTSCLSIIINKFLLHIL